MYRPAEFSVLRRESVMVAERSDQGESRTQIRIEVQQDECIEEKGTNASQEDRN